MASTAGGQQAVFVPDGFAALMIGLAGITAVLLLLPAEGFIAAPAHQALLALFGRSALVLPAALLLVGIVRLTRVRVERSRLVGLALLAVSVLAVEDLLSGGSGGVAGRALAEMLGSALGSLGATVALAFGLACGVWLSFGIRLGQK